ncbi:MAG TPA: hypothetical protein VJR04_17235 [Terriglobales bacterium]|nr:hypothetical protein [Terriglobales bacterium]
MAEHPPAKADQNSAIYFRSFKNGAHPAINEIPNFGDGTSLGF